ncbi:MAG: hypothetical protein ACO3BH_05880 [Quisquiliibacterium sp.]
MATIGDGDIVPKTISGQTATIVLLV